MRLDLIQWYLTTLGPFIKTRHKRINILNSLEYERIANILNQKLLNDVGHILTADPRIINHCILLNSVTEAYVLKGFYLGAGLSANLLLKSSLKTPDLWILGDEIDNIFNNKNYKRITFSVPLIIGYDFKRVNIFTRFNIGLMNRLKYDSYVKEVDNSLILGMGYRINNN